MPAVESANEHFSTTVGLLYVFNLIVGTGALALPSAFQNAGYILGTALLLVSAFTSYICATFVVECMGIANAVIRRTRKKSASFTDNMDSLNSELTEGNRIQNECEITTRVEVSEMSHIFLGRPGIIFTYLVLTVYLFGDLAIYSTTVPKSLMNVVCESINVSTVTRELPCHSHWPEFFSRHNVYRMCIVAFVSFCLPMVYVGMTKTKWIQLFTTASRWTAFLLMIVMALIQLGDNGAQASPPAANFHGFGSLFGVAVYAFMCHHSIPGLVTPVRDKSFFNYKLTSVYAVIFLFYCTLSITGSFAFYRVQDVYTLNFFHDDQTSFFYAIIDYFLALFPVFTLTSSYIIVAITLGNNIKVLLAMATNGLTENTRPVNNTESEALLSSNSDDELNDLNTVNTNIMRRENISRAVSLLTPVVVILLPTVISFMTDNVLLLASITGSYPGVGVQFVIPSVLTIFARQTVKKTLRLEEVPKEIGSPFRHWFWPYITLSWALFAVVIVTINVFHLG